MGREKLTFERLARHLPEGVWRAFEPLLPPVVWCGNGRPPVGNRVCLHAALYVAISGIPWDLMPPCFPCGKTVRGRFRKWLELDVFRRAWAACAGTYQRVRGINFDQVSIDGARKPAKKGARQPAPTLPTAASAAPRWC